MLLPYATRQIAYRESERQQTGKSTWTIARWYRSCQLVLFDNVAVEDMAWTWKNKWIATEMVRSHVAPTHPAVKGRAPGVSAISFTPQELFGAMARTSHLHLIDPEAVTSESECFRHLVARHVDEDADDFSILQSAKGLKDYSRSHMVGVTGDGIAYLQMIRDGYVWCDHFENLRTASKPSRKSPDFVFSRPHVSDVAITESKATLGSSRAQFKRTVESGYLEQVAPYLGVEISGAIASHGFSIGSWMTSPTRAELLIDHTASSVPAAVGPDDKPINPNSVKRGNYLTALSLMFGPGASAAARAGTWTPAEVGYPVVEWIGKSWLVGFSEVAAFTDRSSVSPYAIFSSGPWYYMNKFALELGVARAFLKSLSPQVDEIDPLAGIGRMDDELGARAREDGGAVYPDGFAVLGRGVTPIHGVSWSPLSGEFYEAKTIMPNENVTETKLQASTVLSSGVLRENRDTLYSDILRLKTTPEPLKLTHKGSD